MGHIREKAAAAIAKVEASERDTGTIFVEFDPARILAEAESIDARHAKGETLPLHGLLVSLKDLVDEAGQRTTAGSPLFAEREPATEDAVITRRLRAAGALPFGRTSLSEFAYSGLGLNPHHGTPGNVFDDSRIPGGSSSGAALTVALGWCDAAIGTDTGGSVRLPAAINGLVGYKPTQDRVPRDGVHELSGTYDSIGPLAGDLDTALRIHEVLCDVAPGTLTDTPPPDRPLRFAVATGAFTDGLDDEVERAFAAALKRIGDAGHECIEVDFAEMAELASAVRIIVASEAHAQYEPHFDTLARIGDPDILARIRAAESFAPGEVKQAEKDRRRAVARYTELLEGFDGMLAPTLAVVPPTIADASADFARFNPPVLRNTTMINLTDGCALTLPVTRSARSPGALMIAGSTGRDADVLRAGRAVEACLLTPV